MSTITKRALIDRIAESTQAKRALVKATVQNVLDEIISELAKGNRLEFRDFGVFEPRDCAPRTAQNPKTLERIHVPAKRVVKFKMGQLMKQRVNTSKNMGSRLTK
ncbi:MAG TPA: HU family DNA-binding protein [Sedimentisphaerales bacterium]|nr:HU family DNA-binding protein [Sedimentisphaerales bacterium]